MLCLQAARGSALSLLTVLCFYVRDAFFSFLSVAPRIRVSRRSRNQTRSGDGRSARSVLQPSARTIPRAPSIRERARTQPWLEKEMHELALRQPGVACARRTLPGIVVASHVFNCSLAQLSGARDPKPFLRPVTVTRSTVEPWAEHDETALPVPVRRASLTNLGPRSSAHSRGWGAHAPPKIPCRGLTVRPL